MDTIRADEAFLASLHRQRVFPDDAFVPLLTWITPCPPAPIMALLERFGRIRRLRAGECMFGPNDRFDALVLLTKGLGGRVFGSLYNQPGSAIALSVPGRIIGGNHCFFSGRPGVGQYFLLTEGEALYVPRKQILSELREDVALFECFAAFLDMLFQGDRLGFGAIALLPAKSRLLLWALTWGFICGELETVGGEERLVFEPMLPVSLLSRVVSANPSQVKRDLTALRRSGELVRTGEAHRYEVRRSMPSGSGCVRPRNRQPLFAARWSGAASFGATRKQRSDDTHETAATDNVRRRERKPPIRAYATSFLDREILPAGNSIFPRNQVLCHAHDFGAAGLHRGGTQTLSSFF